MVAYNNAVLASSERINFGVLLRGTSVKRILSVPTPGLLLVELSCTHGTFMKAEYIFRNAINPCAVCSFSPECF